MWAVVIAGIVYLVLAVLAAFIAAVALAEKLPRNRWLGLRTDASLSSEAAFSTANRVAAPSQIGAAAILALGGVGGLLLDGGAALFTVIAAPVIALALVGAGAAVGQKVAVGLAAQPDDLGACGHSCGACSLQDTCEFSVTRAQGPLTQGPVTQGPVTQGPVSQS